MNRIQRIKVWQVVLALAMLGAMVLSFPLWTSERGFPLLPVDPLLPSLPHPWDLVLVGWLGVVLILSIFLRKIRLLPFLALIFIISLGLFDQNRWQPWVYAFGLMFLVLIPFSRQYHRFQDPGRVVKMGQLLMSGFFIWTGIHGLLATLWLKETAGLLPNLHLYFPGYQDHYALLALGLPLLELFTGAALLFRRLRPWGIRFSLTLVVFYGALLGHPQLETAPLAWVFYGAWLLISLALFAPGNRDIPSLGDCLKVPLYRLAFLIVFAAPALHYAGWWDINLASHLHPPAPASSEFMVTKSAIPELPPGAKNALVETEDGVVLDLDRWSRTALGVPVVPEKRVADALETHLTHPENPELAERN